MCRAKANHLAQANRCAQTDQPATASGGAPADSAASNTATADPYTYSPRAAAKGDTCSYTGCYPCPYTSNPLTNTTQGCHTPKPWTVAPKWRLLAGPQCYVDQSVGLPTK